MKLPFKLERHTATYKIAVIAFLVLVLLIPVSMIKNIILDRSQIESVATRDIRNLWGGDQTITGPILRLPYAVLKTTVYGSPFTGYSATILTSQRRAIVLAAVLFGLYAFLYLTLKAENYPLVAGSTGLWFVLAAVMYLTRKINWYATND